MSVITTCAVPLRHILGRIHRRSIINISYALFTDKLCIHSYDPAVCRSFFTISDVSKHQILTNYVPKRLKYRKKEEEDSDSEDEAETVEDVGKDFKILKLRVNSLRGDLVLKAALGMARNKVEAAFFQNKIRLNGGKIQKKSSQLNIEDEVDIVRGTSKMNPEFIVVSRVKLLSYSQRDDKYTVNVQCFRSLTIENYTDDPWRASE